MVRPHHVRVSLERTLLGAIRMQLSSAGLYRCLHGCWKHKWNDRRLCLNVMCICNMCEDAIRGPGYASCCWLLDRRIHCPVVNPHLDTRCGDVELGWTIVVVNGMVVNGFAVWNDQETTIVIIWLLLWQCCLYHRECSCRQMSPVFSSVLLSSSSSAWTPLINPSIRIKIATLKKAKKSGDVLLASDML